MTNPISDKNLPRLPRLRQPGLSIDNPIASLVQREVGRFRRQRRLMSLATDFVILKILQNHLGEAHPEGLLIISTAPVCKRSGHAEMALAI